jgi:hydrogenase-4 component E
MNIDIEAVIKTIMVLLVLADLALLGAGLLSTCITLVAFQGVLIALFVVVDPAGEITLRLALIAGANLALKGFVYPYLLRRAIKNAQVRREVQPFIGYTVSLVLGLVMLGIALWLGNRLPLAGGGVPLAVPAALFTLLTGLYLVMARRNALIQCIGYLVLENGIYAFGLVTVERIPVLLELGLLLDAFVAVFVMGVAIYQIHREFDHIDTDRLDSLKG